MKIIFFIAVSVFSFTTLKADEKLTITSGGVKRSYYLHIPKTLNTASARPLVIALHSGGQTAKEMILFTGFNKFADRDTFFVVYPLGIDEKWNDGRVFSQGETTKKYDDVLFISDLIDHLLLTHKINRERIFVTGMASGGMLCFRLACELSEKIAAIATVGASAPLEVFNTCKPKKVVNVLAIHGQDDNLIPFNGGAVKMDNVELGRVEGLEKVFAYLADYNSEIKSIPFRVKKRDYDRTDKTTIVTTSYTNTKYEADLVLYEIKGGGHAWPGATQFLPPSLTGNVSREIDASQTIWTFFKNIY